MRVGNQNSTEQCDPAANQYLYYYYLSLSYPSISLDLFYTIHRVSPQPAMSNTATGAQSNPPPALHNDRNNIPNTKDSPTKRDSKKRNSEPNQLWSQIMISRTIDRRMCFTREGSAVSANHSSWLWATSASVMFTGFPYTKRRHRRIVSGDFISLLLSCHIYLPAVDTAAADDLLNSRMRTYPPPLPHDMYLHDAMRWADFHQVHIATNIRQETVRVVL